MLRYGKSETKKMDITSKKQTNVTTFNKIHKKNLIRDTQIPLIKSIPLTKKNEKITFELLLQKLEEPSPTPKPSRNKMTIKEKEEFIKNIKYYKKHLSEYDHS